LTRCRHNRIFTCLVYSGAARRTNRRWTDASGRVES
jgi:hypothetical protein